VADAGGLQLLPETRKKIEYHAPGHNRLLIFSVVFLAFIFAVYGGLVYYQKSVQGQLDTINSALVKNEQARSKTDEDMLLNLKDNLAVASNMLTQHLPWSQALTHIQALIVPQVQFENLTVKFDQKQYSFKALAVSYAAVAKQVAAFYSDGAITNIVMGNITAQPDGTVEFSVQLGFDPTKVTK
jgi:Tfp pilus assembly protein PilN